MTELISKDPLAVTAAFSDLIVKQNEIMFKHVQTQQPPVVEIEKPQKQPLSTKHPEDDSMEDFAEFEPRYVDAIKYIDRVSYLHY